jgi:hypothetical protein
MNNAPTKRAFRKNLRDLAAKRAFHMETARFLKGYPAAARNAEHLASMIADCVADARLITRAIVQVRRNGVLWGLS